MGKKQQQAATTPAPNKGQERPTPVFKAPLKPRPVLFRILLVLVALWCATLLTLYFKTVYPHRGEAAPSVEAAPDRTVPR